jgi:hypothetical protein
VILPQDELKSLIRAGIPHQYRAQIWNQCIEFRVRDTKKMAGKDYYQNILGSMAGKFSPAAKQIELDLLRTLPNNKHYDKPDSDGVRICHVRLVTKVTKDLHQS